MNVGVGSLNTQKTSAGFSGAHDGWDYALGLGYESTDGYDTRPDLTHTPDREGSAQRTASLRLGYQLAGSAPYRVHELETARPIRASCRGMAASITRRRAA